MRETALKVQHLNKTNNWEFPGSPVVRTPHFHCQGWGLIPGWGTKIPQIAWHGQKKKKKKDKRKQIKKPQQKI